MNFFPVKTDLYKSINRYGKLYLVAYIKNDKVIGKLVNISLNLQVGEILTEPLMQNIYQESFEKAPINNSNSISLINYNNFIRKRKSTKQPEMSTRGCIATYLVTRSYDGNGNLLSTSEQLIGIVCTGNGGDVDTEDNWDPSGGGTTYIPPSTDIINSVTDPCIRAIINHAINSGIDNKITTILNSFNHKSSTNVTFKNVPNLENGADANISGVLTPFNDTYWYDGTITFNDANLVDASKP